MTYRITDEAANAAGMGRYYAADLGHALSKLSIGEHVPDYLHELHAECAWRAFDALAEWMAKIPRPAKAEEAA